MPTSFLTPEQEQILNVVKIILGDIEGNPYYPMLQDAEYISILNMYKWQWKRAIGILGLSILGMSAGWNTRETVGLETIENNFNKNYSNYLKSLLDDINSVSSLNITPYASGISWVDWCQNIMSRDNIIPELSKIKTCRCRSKCSCGKAPTFRGIFK